MPIETSSGNVKVRVASTGAEVEVVGAEVTGAEVTGAEVTGAEVEVVGAEVSA